MVLILYTLIYICDYFLLYYEQQREEVMSFIFILLIHYGYPQRGALVYALHIVGMR